MYVKDFLLKGRQAWSFSDFLGPTDARAVDLTLNQSRQIIWSFTPIFRYHPVPSVAANVSEKCRRGTNLQPCDVILISGKVILLILKCRYHIWYMVV